MSQGINVLSEALAQQGVKHCFGIVGIPVIELGFSLQASGINYYGFRNEQGAAYAAGAVGYLTNKPGLCLAVSGPGMTNCISGLGNALTNCWPMILLSGSSDQNQSGKGAFQEWDQIESAKPYVKWAVRIVDVKQIPFVIEKACRIALSGRPGPVYIDLPGDVIMSSANPEQIPMYKALENLPQCQAPDILITKALDLLKSAQKPLLIIGKGAAYANASKQLTDFVNHTKLPFLPTPMGKGVVSDFNQNCISPARSTALGQADVIFLIGARLNWILHFGLPPRFNKNVKLIQLDISPEEFGNNVEANVPLYGNCDLIMDQFNRTLKQKPWSFTGQNWWNTLNKKIMANQKASEELLNDKGLPLQYYSAMNIINQMLPKDYLLIGEGANTMDIGRTIFKHDNPKHRLDAGTWGTMGVGMPFALAAKAVHPEKQVVAVVGDSAFGFSGMEIETAIRYNLPFIVIIINNNGIYSGVEELQIGSPNAEIMPTSLNPLAKYEQMATAFGGKGFSAKNHAELRDALSFALKNNNILTIINVAIDPTGAKKPQEHAWLTREEPKSKL